MTHSISDAQITMLRLAKRHLSLPSAGDDGVDHREELALLVMLGLVESHEAGFRITPAGTRCLDVIDRELLSSQPKS